MLIRDIIPYARNARNNEKAIKPVAESIKKYGLRGMITLRSPEDPTIVRGHTRVAACKLLGWSEIPDEHIEYVDDLTDDEVKEFRIADNKTGDIATYNRSMLREEIRSLKDFDTTKFGFDFKSKYREYGAERLRTDNAYNLDICNRHMCGKGGYPELLPSDAAPKELRGFNYAKSTPDEQKKGKGCHFFIDDYQFERLWANPQKYLDILRGYDCVLTPDFSLYMDMPEPMQAWNHYRSQVLGAYWQREGLEVVPTLSWAYRESYKYCFAGIPKGSTVAVSTVGVKNDEQAQKTWRYGMKKALKELEPSCILLYGGSIGFDFGEIHTIEYIGGGFDGW